MYCSNCGAENDNSVKFCSKCGKALDNNQTNTSNASSKAGANQFFEKIKALPKKILLGGIAGIVVLILLICIGVNSSKTINLNKYVTVETSGYDGFGKAKVTVDWDAIEEKYGDKISYTKAAKKEYGDLLSLISPTEALEESVSVSLDNYDNLSNGDEITYTWTIDDDLSDYLNCKVKYKDKTIKVSDLEEVDTFDAFANLEVTFDGVGPDGTVNLNYTGSELSVSDFVCDKSNGLSNGDTITVSINEGNIESLAQSIGKIPAEASKEYVVEGLQSYLTNISDLSSDSLDKLKAQGEDAFNAYVAQSWYESDGESLDSFEFIGTYLLTAKSTDTWGSQNKLYLVFKGTIDNKYDSYHQKNFDYWYIEYDNVVIDEDGNTDIDITSYRTTYNSFTVDSGISSGWFGTYSWYYKGYATLNDLYKDVVTSNADSYNHEDNVEDTESATVSEDTTEEDTADGETSEDETTEETSDAE